MISAKISTNSESLSKFGRGRRMGWRNPVEIPKYICENNLEEPALIN